MSLTYRCGLYTLVPALLIALTSHWAFTLNPLLAWLVAINLVTLLTYGYDKAIAGSGKTRIPEVILLVLGFLGGTLAAFLGMQLFRHKTAKREFQVKFWIVTAVQGVTLLLLYALLFRPGA